MAEKLLRDQFEAASALGGLDPDVAEAAGLAHDLGHPPFGHVAEETLDDLARERGLIDGFEGNAQSFRIVTKLAISDAEASRSAETAPGLNLTRATLNGILKYPWLYNKNKEKRTKWGAYNSEGKIFEWVRSSPPLKRFSKGVEAELMDWADDITFAVHDLVDFYCADKIPLERLGDNSGTAEREAFFEEVFERNSDLAKRRQEFEDAFSTIVDLFTIDRRYVGSAQQRRHMWQLSTVLISRFVDCICLNPDGKHSPVSVKGYAKDEIRVLKELTWHYVIVHHDLASAQHGQKHIIRTLFCTLLHAAQSKKDWKLFPIPFQERLAVDSADHARARTVVDYIASMTEKEAISQFRTLTGST